jgi:hypothetical protein
MNPDIGLTEETIKTMGVVAIVALIALKWMYDEKIRKKENNGDGLKGLVRTMVKDLDEHRIREERILTEICEAEKRQTEMLEKFTDREMDKWDRVAEAIDRLKDTIREVGGHK